MLRFVMVLCVSQAAAAAEPKDAQVEHLRYLRPAGAERFEPECEFRITRGKEGWEIHSATLRNKEEYNVVARYDANDKLLSAWAGLKSMTNIVSVKGDGKKVVIEQPKSEPLSLEVRAGVIVTSAPDWTDTLLVCRRYDFAKAGKQEFPGLWIHPTQPIKQPAFAVEHLGQDTIEHDGKKLNLERVAIQLRKGSDYVAWIDGKGRMIKLVPMPYKENTRTGLVLEGYAESTRKLWPANKP